MNLSALSQIEAHIAQLSFAEQLWLLERVAQRLRTQCATPSAFDPQHQTAPSFVRAHPCDPPSAI